MAKSIDIQLIKGFWLKTWAMGSYVSIYLLKRNNRCKAVIGIRYEQFLFGLNKAPGALHLHFGMLWITVWWGD